MFKFLKKVKIEFNPFDSRSTSALEFLGQCTSPKAIESNPSCVVSVERRTDERKPEIKLTYNNGEEEVIDGATVQAIHIREGILKKSQALECQQMFVESGQPWPVIIPREEFKEPLKYHKPKIVR